jgi:uncharacterized protein (UPF0548 family)
MLAPAWHCGAMFVWGRPITGDLERVLSEQASEGVTYDEVGATRGSLPEGYRHDRHVIDLGVDERSFRHAIDGLRGWEAHRRAGLMVHPAEPAVRQGQTVVLAFSLLGISAIAACRIVYVIDEPDQVGFAYGTLPAHPEQGEEAFMVQRDDQGTVRFVVTAFSRPRHPLARLGSPIARQIQLSVTRRYLNALVEFVSAN